MKLYYLLLLASAFLFFSGCRPAAAPVSISNKPVSINDVRTTNQPMPPSKPFEEMTWTKFDGQTGRTETEQKLKDLQGKVVILDFWATNCPPCIQEIPHLKELQAKYGQDNLQVIGLHVGDDDDFRQVPAFVEKLQIDYPLAKPENALSSFIFSQTDSIPQTAIFDRSGKLVEKIVGFDAEIKGALDAAVEKAINSKS